MSKPATTEACESCGKSIPPGLIRDALCVRCRYSGSGKRDQSEEPTPYEMALAETPAPAPFAELEPELRGGALGVLEISRRAVLYIVEGGRRDGAATRAAAVGYLFGVWTSLADAGEAVKSGKSVMFRTVSEAKASIAEPLVGTDGPGKTNEP